MGQHLGRGMLLASQQRFELAERELRQALVEDPNSTQAHTMLAWCLVAQDKLDGAQQAADAAVMNGPMEPDSHRVQAKVLHERGKVSAAETAVREAIRLDPWNSHGFSILCTILMSQDRWPEALAAVEQGLQFDSEDVQCIALRSLILRQLNRPAEALAAAELGLAQSPENAALHAARGWTLIDQRRPDEALVHFRESLRIDPSLEFARQGVVTALKVRYRFYALVHAYFRWVQRLSPNVRAAIVFGPLLLGRVSRAAARAIPAWQPVAAVIGIAYLLFVLTTWLADPLFNLLLRFNRFGRLALNAQERRESTAMASCVAAALVVLLFYPLIGGYALGVACGCLAMMLPALTVIRSESRLYRWLLTLLCGILVLCLLMFFAIPFAEKWGAATPTWRTTATVCIALFVIGVVGSSWVGAAAALRGQRE